MTLYLEVLEHLIPVNTVNMKLYMEISKHKKISDVFSMYNENKNCILLDSLSACNANKPEVKCASLGVYNKSELSII